MYRAGNYQVAEAQVQSEGSSAVANPDNGDHLIYLLEEGAIYRTAGNLELSNKMLDQADTAFSKTDRKAYVRVGREAYAAVTNLADLNYEGYGYDRLMMNAYKALNYMEQGNMNFARAELKRVAYAQQKIEQHKAERIKDAKEAASEGTSQDYDANRAMNDPAFRAQTQGVYGTLPDERAKAVYVNAFAEYLQGIFLVNNGDAEDREIGRAALKRTLAMVDNQYVRADLETLDKADGGIRVPPATYVIFESGVAPRRDEIRIDIPIFIYNIAARDTSVDYIGAAFPVLVPESGGLSGLNIRTSTGTYPTQLLVDMDAVVGKEFKDELPTVITRTLIAAGSKATVAYLANRATRGNGSTGDTIVNLLTRAAATAYQYATNRADLRTWRTLPKMIVVSRFDTPADGNLTIMSPRGTTVAITTVKPNSANIVWVRGPSDFGPLVCRSFALGATK